MTRLSSPAKTASGLLCLWLVLVAPAAAQDARDIVRRFVQADEQAERLRRDYTYRVLKRGVADGRAVSEMREVLFLAGRKYERVIQRDGKPLSARDEASEQEKLDRAVAAASKLSPEARQKQINDSIRRTNEQRRDMRSIPDAFDFAIEKEIEVNGRTAWQIHARPRAGYKGPGAGLFGKLEGTLWIDRRDYAWVRADVTALDTVSVGLFLLRMSKGARLHFENMKVNDELWALKQVGFSLAARVGLVKKVALEEELTYSDYRRFRTESRVVGAEEVH